MNNQNSKRFLNELKENINIINNVVSKVTVAASATPNECDVVEVTRDLDEKMFDIKEIRKDAIILKEELETKNSYFGDYFHDFQELVLEIEETVGRHEKHLQKFGYEPLETVSVESQPTIETPHSKEDNKKTNKTPSIYEYIGAVPIDHHKCLSNSSKKSSDEATPKLIFDQCIKKCINSEELLETSNKNKTLEDSVFVKENETIPSLSFDNSLVECHPASDASYSDYQKIARKLNF